MSNFKVGVQINDKDAKKALSGIDTKIKDINKSATTFGKKGGKELGEAFNNSKIGSFTNKISGLVGKFTGLSGGASVLATGILGIGTASGIATLAMIKLASSTAKMADDAGKASQRMGVSIEYFQKMESAAGHAGTSMSTMQTAMRTMLRTMNQVDEGNDKMAETYEDLGIAIYDTDGAMRSQEDVFTDMLMALADMENATERNAKAQILMGRSANELAPLLNEGTDAIRKYIKENNSAIKVTSKMAKSGALYNDTIQTMGEELSKAKNKGLEPFMESMANLAVTLSESGMWDSFLLGVTGAFDVLSQLMQKIETVALGFDWIAGGGDRSKKQQESMAVYTKLFNNQKKWIKELADDKATMSTEEEEAYLRGYEMNKTLLEIEGKRAGLTQVQIENASRVLENQKREIYGLEKINKIVSSKKTGGGSTQAISLAPSIDFSSINLSFMREGILKEIKTIEEEMSTFLLKNSIEISDMVTMDKSKFTPTDTKLWEDNLKILMKNHNASIDKWERDIDLLEKRYGKTIRGMKLSAQAISLSFPPATLERDLEAAEQLFATQVESIKSEINELNNIITNEGFTQLPLVAQKEANEALASYKEALSRIPEVLQLAKDEIIKGYTPISVSDALFGITDGMSEQDVFAQKLSAYANWGTQLTDATMDIAGSMATIRKNARDKELEELRVAQASELSGYKMSAMAKEALAKKHAKESEKITKKQAEDNRGLQIANTIAGLATGTAAIWANSFQTIPNPIAAAVVAGSMSTLLAGVTGFQMSAINTAGYEDGGVIGGYQSPTSGKDNTLVSMRTSEMALNARQQQNLFEAIDTNSLGQSVNLSIENFSGGDDELNKLEGMLHELVSGNRVNSGVFA